MPYMDPMGFVHSSWLLVVWAQLVRLAIGACPPGIVERWCLRSCFMMPGPLGVRVLHLRLFRAGRCFLFGFLLFGVGWGFGLLLGAVDGQDSPRNPNILPSRVTFCGKLLDQYHGISWFSHQTFIFTSHIQVKLNPSPQEVYDLDTTSNKCNKWHTHTHNKRTFLHVDLSTCPFEPPGNLMESDMGMTQLYVWASLSFFFPLIVFSSENYI